MPLRVKPFTSLMMAVSALANSKDDSIYVPVDLLFQRIFKVKPFFKPFIGLGPSFVEYMNGWKGFVAHDGEFHLDEFAQTTWQWLTERMSYLPGDLNNPETYRRLGEHLTGLDKTAGTAGNRLFYLAVADRFFGPAVAALGEMLLRLQRQIDVQSEGPSQALLLAERLVNNERLNADCVEVMHLASHHEFEQQAGHSAASQHAESRRATN